MNALPLTGLPILLAQAMQAADAAVSLAQSPRTGWAPVVLLIAIGVLFAVGTLVTSILIGPSRTGPGKQTTYESGMVPVGDAHKRFNVRFYIVAMVFLVIDVEVVFFYPWASIFAPYVRQFPDRSTMILIEMLVFVAILLVAYLYAWGKGVFRWE
jgi:NADH-quinone oxidoreductase subunit A